MSRPKRKKALKSEHNVEKEAKEEEAYYNQNANGKEFFFFSADEYNDSGKRIVKGIRIKYLNLRFFSPLELEKEISLKM